MNTSAYRIYLLRQAVSSFLGSMISVVLAVYYVRTVGLNPLQLVLVGTALEIAAFFCEIPTGVVADTYSRKWSVIIGHLLRGLCYVIQGLVPSFGFILLASAVNGVGWTFTSGAEDAWLADEIGVANVGRAQLRSSQVGSAFSFVGLAVGVVLASMTFALPIFLGGVAMMGLGVFLAFFMPETGFKPERNREHSVWKHLGGTFTAGAKLVRGSTILLLIIAIAFIYGGFSEGFDRLWQAHFIRDIGFPALGSGSSVALGPFVLDSELVWFGIIAAGSTLLSLTITEWLRRRVDTNSHAVVSRALLVINALLVIAVVSFGLAGSFLLALASLWAISVLRSVGDPLTMTWITQHTRSEVRATVISMWSQADAFGQMTCGPAVGGIATAAGMPVAIAISGLILTPALLLYNRTFRHGKQDAAGDTADDGAISEPAAELVA